MHDVERTPRNLGELDRPVGRLLFERHRAGEAVVERVDVAASERLCDQHIDRGAVLGVHHDHRAVLRGLLHRPQDLAVVAEEDAGIGHEELHAGNALLANEAVHGRERVVVDPADDHVKRVVDRAVAVGLAVPCFEPVEDAFPGPLDREVDDRRGATPSRRAGARLEGVGRRGPAERQLHVGVRVDTAGHHVLSPRVDDTVRRGREVTAERRRARLHESGDLLTVDEHVHVDRAARRDHRAVCDEGRHGHASVSGPYMSGRRSR